MSVSWLERAQQAYGSSAARSWSISEGTMQISTIPKAPAKVSLASGLRPDHPGGIFVFTTF